MSPRNNVSVFTLRIDTSAEEAFGGVVSRDDLDQFLFRKPLETFNKAEDRMEEADQGRDAFRARRRQRDQMRSPKIGAGIHRLLQE